MPLFGPVIRSLRRDVIKALREENARLQEKLDRTMSVTSLTRRVAKAEADVESLTSERDVARDKLAKVVEALEDFERENADVIGAVQSVLRALAAAKGGE